MALRKGLENLLTELLPEFRLSLPGRRERRRTPPRMLKTDE